MPSLSATTDRTTLLKACQSTARVINARSTMPIMSHLRLSVDTDVISVMGSDLTAWHEVSFPISDVTAQPGMSAIPAKTLVDVLSLLSSEQVTLVDDQDEAVIVSGGKSKNKILNLPGDEYPVMPSVENGVSFRMGIPVLTSILNEVGVAMSADLSRSVLCGVFIESVGGELRFSATDTHSLASRSTPMADVADFSAILPSAAVLHLIAILPPSGGVDICVSDVQAEFRWTVDGVTTRYVSLLVAGQFPNYRRVVPDSADWSMLIERDALKSAVALAAIFAVDDSNRVAFVPGDQALRLMSLGNTRGGGNDEVDCVINGGFETFRLNCKYVAEVLRVMPSEGIKVEGTGPLRPVVFRPIDSDHDAFWLVMPMQAGAV